MDDIRQTIGKVKIDVPLSIMDDRVKRAQYALDNAVMESMVPYMPMQTSNLIRLTRQENQALAGSGVVCAAAGPYGRYLYYGVKMVDSVTGKGPMKMVVDGRTLIRYKYGSTLRPTNIPLNISTAVNPLAQSKWFEVAKANHQEEWEEVVAEVLGGEA